MRSTATTALALVVSLVFAGFGAGCRAAPSAGSPERTVTTTTSYTVPPEIHETRHLPKGVRIQVGRPRAGMRSSVFAVVASGSVEHTGSLVSEKTLSSAVPGEIWVGTGSRSNAKVKYLKIGTKWSNTSDWVTDDSTTIKASAARIATSSRVVGPKRGTRISYVQLGPQATEMIDEPMVVDHSDYGVFDSYSYWDTGSGGGPIEPTGTWISIVEIDGRPAVWRAFQVK